MDANCVSLRMDSAHAEAFKRRYQYLRHGAGYSHRLALVCAWMWGCKNRDEFRARVMRWCGKKNYAKTIAECSKQFHVPDIIK